LVFAATRFNASRASSEIVKIMRGFAINHLIRA
jgi:hypothetical protein